MKSFHEFKEDLNQKTLELKNKAKKRHDEFKSKTLGAQQAAQDREDEEQRITDRVTDRVKKELRSGK